MNDTSADLSDAQRMAIEALAHDDEVIRAPLWLARQAHVPNDAVERAQAAEDPEGFWGERAGLVEWETPWTKVAEIDPPRHAWFVGGTLNVTVSCIDRHTVDRAGSGLRRSRGRPPPRITPGRRPLPVRVGPRARLLRRAEPARDPVVGLPDPLKGEHIKAFVVLRPGTSEGPGLMNSLRDHVRQDLGPIAVPSAIDVVAALPKTRSGKIVRRYLKAIELGEDPGDLSTLAG